MVGCIDRDGYRYLPPSLNKFHKSKTVGLALDKRQVDHRLVSAFDFEDLGSQKINIAKRPKSCQMLCQLFDFWATGKTGGAGEANFPVPADRQKLVIARACTARFYGGENCATVCFESPLTLKTRVRRSTKGSRPAAMTFAVNGPTQSRGRL